MHTFSLHTPSALNMSGTIKSLWHWLVDAPADQPVQVRASARQPQATRGALLPTKAAHRSHASASRPLRVVRVLENGVSGTTARLRISGRMADVCAELDRLASAEARLH